MSVISSGRQAEGEPYTWVRVSSKGPFFSDERVGLRKRKKEKKNVVDRRAEAVCRGHGPEAAAVRTGCSSALMELRLSLSSPHSEHEQIDRREPSWLHNPPLLCCVCRVLFSKTQDGAATRLCNRCTCASRLSS